MAAAGSLGAAIRARLDELGLPARRFTAAGFISAATLSRVLAGQEALRDPARAAELERGLGWRPGSINGLRTGAGTSAIPVRDWPRPDGDWRAAVEAAWFGAGGLQRRLEGPADLVPADLVASLTDFLFRTVHSTTGVERSFEEVSDLVAQSGRSLSASELEDLRTGDRTMLNRLDAQALAGAFGVPTSYFFDPVDTERVKRQLAAVAALRDAGVERVATRFAGLSEDNRKTAEALIEHLRSAEGDAT